MIDASILVLRQLLLLQLWRHFVDLLQVHALSRVNRHRHPMHYLMCANGQLAGSGHLAGICECA